MAVVSRTMAEIKTKAFDGQPLVGEDTIASFELDLQRSALGASPFFTHLRHALKVVEDSVASVEQSASPGPVEERKVRGPR